jgi:hypothetical protein
MLFTALIVALAITAPYHAIAAASAAPRISSAWGQWVDCAPKLWVGMTRSEVKALCGNDVSLHDYVADSDSYTALSEDGVDFTVWYHDEIVVKIDRCP